MVIVGLSPVVHESACGLLVDGKLVAAAAEERFTRKKNDGGFPRHALDFCLASAGVSAKDVDHVAYAALPFAKERARDVAGWARNVAYVAGAADTAAHKIAHLLNYSRNLVVNNEWLSWGGTERGIRRDLAACGLADRLIHVDHHLAHVAGAYYASGFERCLAVSLDGYGSGQAGSFYLAEKGKLRLLAAIPYPHSLGTFYRRVTQALGFKPNRHEGKIVGLAAFGDPSKLYAEVRARFDLDHDDYFRFKSSQDPTFERRLAREHSREDVAAAYQRVLEDVAALFIQKWVRKTGVAHVACAGGVFANVKMNQRIMELPEIEQLFVFPAMGDGGVGVGAALALQADLRGLAPQKIPHVFLGPSYSERQLEAALQGLRYRRSPNVEDEIVDHLIANRVVARFDGAMEFGPRALGNRSILYPALEPQVNQWLNQRLKRTEFMPFAPVTLDEHAAERYVNVERMRHTGQFMTVTTDCTPLMRRESPAAVHVDGTARPQLVRQDVHASLHRVLTGYHRKTGIPTLINTSYNMHEEPIVCSPEDAVRAFRDGRLEVLALGPFLVENLSPLPLIRVAYVIGSYQRFTGSQRSLWLLVRGLDRSRFAPTIILPGEGMCADRFRELDVPVVVDEPPAVLAEFGGGLLRASFARRAFLAATAVAPWALRLARRLRDDGIDLLHANDSRGLLLGGPAARMARVPAIWHVRGDVSSLGPVYLNACGALATRIITVADAVRRSVPEPFSAKIVNIYNGVAPPRPARRSRAQLDAGGAAGAAGEGPLVIAVGSLVPFKGAHHLVEAARLCPRVRVVFVGDRPDPDYARMLDERAAGLGNVRFAGWDDDPADWFHAADIVCLPTVAHEVLGGREVAGTEGLSRTVLEAMAHGCAIVASNVAGVPEQLEHDRSGLIVPPSDPRALAAAIQRLAGEPTLRVRLGLAAARRAAERFSIGRMVGETSKLYASLC